MKKTNLILCLVVFALAWGTPSIYGQGSGGSISGTVSDATGGVLPGVEVTITNVDTGQSRFLVTGDEGRYNAVELSIGNYEVRAELVGFQTAVRQGVGLQVGQEAVIDLSLAVGEISEEVIVTGEAPLINTTSATLSSVIDSKQVHDLPLNARNLVELSLLSPGVVQARDASYGGQTTSPAAVKISMGGARIYMTGYLLDGTDITDSSRSSGVGGSAGSLFGVETVAEFNVIQNNYSAQYSRFAGGVISLVTKSGTNNFHGSGFWFHRNDNFDARNFFDRAIQPEFKRHQFGGTIGGPIVEDRSFFFFSYEGYRQNTGRSLTAFVPNADAHRGILPGVAEPVDIHPGFQPFLDLYPLPNGRDLGGGRGEYFAVSDEPVNEDFITARIDHTFSDSDSFFGRYTMSDGDRGIPNALPITGWLSDSFATYVTLEEKHIFSASVINTFRVGFQRTTWSQAPPVDDPCNGDCTGSQYDTSGVPGQPFGQFLIGGGFSTLGIFVVGQNVTNMYSYSDDLFITRGNHSIKAGTSLVRHQNNDHFSGWVGGRYQFTSLENALIGNPTEWRGKIPGASSLRGPREWVIGFYVQDDIKLTPNFTVNLGLRYETITTPVEVNGIQFTLGPDPLNVSQPTDAPPFFDNPTRLNFAPRIGLAWDPFGDGKTSIRTGFGIFHDTILFYQYANAMRRNCPPNTTAVLRSGIGFPRPNAPGLSDECPFGRVGFQAIEFHVNQPYMMQWNFSVERELVAQTTLALAYVGSRGVHLLGHRNINTAEPIGTLDGRKFFGGLGDPAAPRRNPAFVSITYWDYGYDSFYHGMTGSLRKRFADNLSFQLSYTWGRSLDTNTRANSGDVAGAASEPQDTYDLRQNKGASDHQVEQAFRLNWAYALPISGFSGVAGTLLQGWQLQGIVSLRTGGPLSISTGGGAGLTDFNGDRARGQERPDLRPGASPSPVLADGRDPSRYFDTNAFLLQSKGTFGNLARNPLVGPGVATLDFSLLKETNLSEAITMQFRAEFFNILNRTNFGRPSTGIFNRAVDDNGDGVLEEAVTVPGGQPEIRRNSTTGRITSTGTTSRQIQFGLRFIF